MFFVFAVMLERKKKMPRAWVTYARRCLHDTAAPVWLRGVAANVVALGRSIGDIAWIRSEVRTTSNEDYLRALLVALRRANALDAASKAHAYSVGPYLSRTVDYLEHARYLPSLTKVHAYVKIMP